MRQTARQSGFTLLEILVALAIISIVMLATLHGSSSAVRNSGYLKLRTLAHWVAMNKAAELRLAREWIPLDRAEGETVMAGQEWHWEIIGQNTKDPDLRRADIGVWEKKKESDPLASLVVYVGRPQGL